MAYWVWSAVFAHRGLDRLGLGGRAVTLCTRDAVAADTHQLVAPRSPPAVRADVLADARADVLVDSSHVARWARPGGSRCPETTASRLRV